MKNNNNYAQKLLTAVLLASYWIELCFCTTYYVDPSAIGTGYGTSWYNAFKTLDAALKIAEGKFDEIYLKGGHTYTPSKYSDRADCFVTNVGVSIYGGFDGTETTKDDRSDPVSAPQSIISGDIGIEDDHSDNCYHVITYHERLLLDNVVIQHGQANYAPSDYSTRSLNNLHRYGGAIMNYDSNKATDLVLQSVIVRNNTALNGGAMWFKSSLSDGGERTRCEVVIYDSIFEHNTAIAGEYEGGYAGAIYSYALANVTIFNTQFNYNKAAFRGGALYQDYRGMFQIYGCNFTENKANGWGGAYFAEDRNAQKGGTFPVVFWSTFTRNYAGLDGGAIFFYNSVHSTLVSNVFDSNEAEGKGGAIALIDSYIDIVYTYNYTNEFNETITVEDTVQIIPNDERIGTNITQNYTDTFINNTAHGNINTSDIYYEPPFTYEQIDWDLTFNLTDELNELYSTYISMSPNETDLYPWNSAVKLCYVDINNNNNNQNGSSWDTAFNNLQDCLDALGPVYYDGILPYNFTNATNTTMNPTQSPTMAPTTSAGPGGEIWVASGIYIPTKVPEWKKRVGKSNNLYLSFEMYDNIRMYGGFKGIETNRDERNWRDNPTILSCQYSNKLQCSQILNSADNTLIDGFIFENAGNGVINNERRLQINSITVDMVLSTTVANLGGGIYSNSTTVSIVNTIFHKLVTGSKGGAMYCVGQQGSVPIDVDPRPYSKSPNFVNVAFLGNRAGARGGAISADADCHFTCNQCKFDSNSCSKKGGAIYLDWDCDPIFINTTFKNNYALESGACIAADGESWVTFLGETSFISNWAKMEAGCLYSGSGVDRQIEQGFIFEQIPIWENNSMEYSYINDDNNSVYIGQPNHWGWPYTDFQNDKVPEITTQRPTISPTPSPISNVVHNDIQPNVIVFFVDDLQFIEEWNNDPYNLAPQGTDLVNFTVSYGGFEIPNIKAFLKESVVFTNSYSTAPMCGPSRFSLLTGRQASRSEWSISRSEAQGTLHLGANVSVHTSKLFTNDSIYNIPYTLQNDQFTPYYTGMVGKWHLLSPNNNNNSDWDCASLDYNANAVEYQRCKNLLYEQGFDFVDAWYYGNVPEFPTDFSHNPEWMVSQSQKFIDTAINVENKPFFLYFATTLTHTPSAKQALLDYTYTTSPKGELSGDDIPDDTAMRSREEIWKMATKYADETTLRADAFAMHYWLDEQFGALITYLQKKNIYDNTMIIFMSDHGMTGKGLLFEQGTKIIQSVRYPPLFGGNDNGFILPKDFVVSNVDTAAVIFDVTQVTPPPEYIMDSKSWVIDVQNYISNPTSNSIVLNDPNFCCGQRYMDMYNSHSIVTKKYQYIYRKTGKVETEMGVDKLYPHTTAKEQLYNLIIDPNERKNILNTTNTMDAANRERLQSDMQTYLDSACPVSLDKGGCLKPGILVINKTGLTTTTLDPNSHWCFKRKDTIYYNEIHMWNPLNAKHLESIFASTAENFYNTHKNCAPSLESLQYIRMYTHIRRRRHRFNILVCCAKSFASEFEMPYGYSFGVDESAFEISSNFKANDSQKETIHYVLDIMFYSTIIAVCLCCCVAIWGYIKYYKIKKSWSIGNEQNIEKNYKDEEHKNVRLPDLKISIDKNKRDMGKKTNESNIQMGRQRAPSDSSASRESTPRSTTDLIRNRTASDSNTPRQNTAADDIAPVKSTPINTNGGDLSPIPGSPPEAPNSDPDTSNLTNRLETI